MNAVKRYAAPAALILVIYITFFFLRQVPSAKLWKGYTILSVPVSSDGSLVQSVLEEEKAGDFIALETQRPLETQFPIEQMIFSTADDSYSQKRLLYFYDREKSSRIYYIPDQKIRQAKKALHVLQNTYHIDANFGSRSSYPWPLFLITLAVFVFFLYVSQLRFLYFAAALSPLVFAAAFPYYSAAVSTILEFYVLFLLQRVWRRKGAVPFMAQSRVFILFALSSLLISFSVNLIVSLCYVLNLCASALSLFLILNLEKAFEKKIRFVPIPIRSANRSGSMNGRSVQYMLCSGTGAFFVLLVFFTGTNFSPAKNAKGLFFPSPAEYNENNGNSLFAGLDDYFYWKWNQLAGPYRSLNKGASYVPDDGEKIEWIRYEKVGGRIVSKKSVLAVFDEKFKGGALKEIDALDYPAVEKLWRAQDRIFSTVYSSGRTQKGGALVLMSLLAALFVPLGAALYYILFLRRGEYAF